MLYIFLLELSHQSDLGQQSVSLCEDDSILDDSMSVSLFESDSMLAHQNEEEQPLPVQPSSTESIPGPSSTTESNHGNTADSASSAPSIESQSVCDPGEASDFDVSPELEDHSDKEIPDRATSSENDKGDSEQPKQKETPKRNARASKIQPEPDQMAPLADPWEPITPHEAANTIPKPIRRGRTRRAPTRNVQLTGTKSRPRKQPLTANETQTIVPVEDFMIQQLSGGKYSLNGLRVGNKETGMAAELQDRADNVEKERKRRAAFENKQNNNIPTIANIENFPPLDPPDDGDNDDRDDGSIDENILPNEDELVNEPMPDPHEPTREWLEHLPQPPPTPPETQFEEEVDSYEKLVIQRVAEYVAQSQDYIASTDLAKRVATWHDSIGPRLDAVEKRGNFDIHQYGSKILDHFPEGNAKTTITFIELAQGKEREEVARYFLSSLMLANTYNVEIKNEIDGPLMMDHIEMTLLTKKRHHENMFQETETNEHNRSTTSPKRKGRQRKSSVVNNSFTSDEDIYSNSPTIDKKYKKGSEKSKGTKLQGVNKRKTSIANGLLLPIAEETVLNISKGPRRKSNQPISSTEPVQTCSVNLDRLDDSDVSIAHTSLDTHNSVPNIPESLRNGVINKLNSATFKVPLTKTGDLKPGKKRKMR